MNCRLTSIGLCLIMLLGAGTLRGEELSPDARQKSVTIYPIVITHSQKIPAELQTRIAEVLGLFLEKAGMKEIEIGEKVFSPPETNDVSQIAATFGQFVAKEPLKTEYAVFGQFVGTREKWLKEIRTIVVDKAGEVVFAERADQQHLAGSKIKPTNPMAATLFVASRLQEIWALGDPQSSDGPKGKMAQLMRKRSGLPPEEEMAAMEKRLQVLKDNVADAEVTVYPIHLWPGLDRSGAAKLADMLNRQGICHAVVSETDPGLTIEGDPNEQKILWDTARAFREFLRKNPPKTEYALLADYCLRDLPNGEQRAHHVHLILCDHLGDWVSVDFQNSHHPDFHTIAPKTVDDCNRLAVLRAKELKKQLSGQGTE